MSDLPVGTILAFAGNFPDLPQYHQLGWRLCDGSPVYGNDQDYYFVETVWGSTYGQAQVQGGATTYFLPDLRGYFLRGVDPNGDMDPDGDARTSASPTNGGNSGRTVGSRQSSGVGPHSHAYQDWGNGESTWDGHSCPQPVVQTTTTTFSTSEGVDACGSALTESRPINMNVYFLIKTRPQSSLCLPASSVVQYGGNIEVVASAPNWLLCNGSPLPSETSELAGVLQSMYGQPETGNALLPDYSGRFLRGLDPSATIDPGPRTAPQPDLPQPGNAGPQVGSLEQCTLGAHTHNYPRYDCHCRVSNCSSPTNTAEYLCCCCRTYLPATTGDTSSAIFEVRPRNSEVYFLIATSTFGPTFSQGDMPVGSIIAYGGDLDALDDATWLLCDGSAKSFSEYHELGGVLDFAYGSDSLDTFFLPNLQGLFLRGVDEAIDRQVPSSGTWKQGNASGVGSLQMDSVNSHTHGLNLTQTQYTISIDNTYQDFVCPNTYPYDFATDTSTGFSDTRPLNTYVYFLIKAR